MTNSSKQLLRAENALARVEGLHRYKPCKHYERVIDHWSKQVTKLKDAQNVTV